MDGRPSIVIIYLFKYSRFALEGKRLREIYFGCRMDSTRARARWRAMSRKWESLAIWKESTTLMLRQRSSLWLKLESELLRGSADAIIKTQKFHSRYSGTDSQCRRQVNGVKGADGFRGKGMSRAVDNVRTDSPQVPVGGRGIQVCPAIGGRGFIDFSEGDGANQHAIALDERKIRGHHEFGTAEHFPHGVADFFPEQPRQHSAGLRINVHRAPRS